MARRQTDYRVWPRGQTRFRLTSNNARIIGGCAFTIMSGASDSEQA